MARATPQPQYVIAFERPTSLEMRLASSGSEMGEGKMEPLMMVLFSVFKLCPGTMGSDLMSSATLALGQQRPVTMRMRKFLFILACSFSVCYCHTCSGKKKKKKKRRGNTRGKGSHFFLFWSGLKTRKYWQPIILHGLYLTWFPLWVFSFP